MITAITVCAFLAFAGCGLRLVLTRRARTVSVYTGSHRRAQGQPPTRKLRYAMATVGTHGLGMIREREDS